jgi:TolB-like protein
MLAALVPLTAQEKPILAVLDFQTEDLSSAEARSLVSLLSSALFSTGRYTVVDVEKRETVLKEIAFSLSGCTDESCQIEVGRLLAAELIVTGNISRVGNRVVFSAKLMETSTGKTLATADGVYGSMDALLDALPQLAGKLAGVEVAGFTGGGAPVDWKFIGIVSLAVIGAGGLGYGGWAVFDAGSYKSGTVDPAWAAYEAVSSGVPADYDAAYSEYQTAFAAYLTKTTIAYGALAGGALSLGGALAWWLWPSGDAAPPVSVLPLPNGIGVTFRF